MFAQGSPHEYVVEVCVCVGNEKLCRECSTVSGLSKRLSRGSPQRGGHAKEVQELAEHTNAPARPPVLEHGSLKLFEVVQVRLLMVRAESFEAACEEGVVAMQAGRFRRLLLDVVLAGLLFIEDCLMLHDTPDVEREAGRQGSRATAALCRPILYGATLSHNQPPANHEPTNCFVR